MKYSIDLVKKENVSEILKLALISEIDEQVDTDCDFICAYDRDIGLVGVVGINLKKEHYPQFEHIIIHPRRQRTRLSVMLMNKMEEYLKDKGYREFVSFIRSDRKVMVDYALRWGMRIYNENERGKWLYKSLAFK